MQSLSIALYALLLVVTRVSADQPQEVQPAVGQPQPVVGHSVGEQPQVHHVHPSGSYPSEPVQAQAQPQQPQHEHQHQPPQPQQHYAPAGVIQVVQPNQASPSVPANSQPQPQGVIVTPSQQQALVPPQHYAAEQYGKPESTGIPPNYKPFGSWGLYIGGNPADGYYSNYYKALGSSVEKQQQSGVVGESVKPAVSPAGQSSVGQVSAFNPMLKQAVSYPYGSYADQVYPFDYYTSADLNSGSRVAVVDQQGPSVYSAGHISSPAQIGAQVYGSSVAAYSSEQPVGLAYADSYSTKRIGSSSYGSKGSERAQPVQQQQQQQVEAKGYQARYYQPAQHFYSAQHQAPAQVVAYPVPVGSQIVGSQPGADGAYAPYGVHGYTRYAIKPTVVSSAEQQSVYNQGVHSAPAGNFPVYKQQVYQPQAHQPLSFYGYPLSQLHYSQGSIVPAFGQSSAVSGVSVVPSNQGVEEQVHKFSPVVEAAGSEKLESVQDKQKEQKRA